MFRKFFLVGVLALVLPATSQGAITIDPGTHVMVKCDDKRPFRGQPFTTEGATWFKRFPSSDGGKGFTVGSESSEGFFATAHVFVRRLSNGLFRIRAERGERLRPARWRGC